MPKAEIPLLKLKEIKAPFTALLTDYAGPFSSPDYGDSWLLNLQNPKSKEWAKIFLGEKTAACRAFLAAMSSGRLAAVDKGGTIEAIFRPRQVKGPKGEEFVMIDLRFGKSTDVEGNDKAQEEIPF